MPKEFNPYHKWLGIPPNQQPANHYQLLGIANFENDLEVISAAADRQMAHLRTKSSGNSSDLSEKLLNEIAQAKIVLLNNDKREAYNKALQKAEEPTKIVIKTKEIRNGEDLQNHSSDQIINQKKPRSKNRNARKNILIIQNTIAIALAIVALVSLWLFYPVMVGNQPDNITNNSSKEEQNQAKKDEISNQINAKNNTGVDKNNSGNERNPSFKQQTTNTRKAKVIVDLTAAQGNKISAVANENSIELIKAVQHTFVVEPGMTRIALKRDGYLLITKSFELATGQTEFWEPRWKPSASIIIETGGDDIQVAIDGQTALASDIKDMQNGSKQIFVVPGEHEIEINRRNYKAIVETVILNDNEDRFFNPNWRKPETQIDVPSTNAIGSVLTDRDKHYAGFEHNLPPAFTQFGEAPNGKNDSKLNIPNSSDIKTVTAKLNENIPDFQGLTSLQQLCHLANSCRQARSETDPVAKYCRLDICRQMAIQLGQPAIAVWMVDHMGHWYDIEPLGLRKMRIHAIDNGTRKIVDPQHISEAINLVRKMSRDIRYRDQNGELLAIVRRIRSRTRRLKAEFVEKDLVDIFTHLTMADWLVDYRLDPDDQSPSFIAKLFATDLFKDAVLYERWDAFIDEYKNGTTNPVDENHAELVELAKRISAKQFENKADVELANLFWDWSEPVKLAEPNLALKNAARFWYLRSSNAVSLDQVREVTKRFLESELANAPSSNQPSIWIEMLDEQGWRRATAITGGVNTSEDGIEITPGSSVDFGEFPVPGYVIEMSPVFKSDKGCITVVIAGDNQKQIQLNVELDQSQLVVTANGINVTTPVAETTEKITWTPNSSIQFFVRPGEIDICVNYKLKSVIPFFGEQTTLRFETNDQTSVTLREPLIRRWTSFDHALTGLLPPVFRHECDVAYAALQLYGRMDLNLRQNQKTRWSRRNIGAIHAPMHPVVTNRTLSFSDSENHRYVVSFEKNYWITDYEITQRQWHMVMGTTPSWNTGSPYLPIDQVSYSEVAEFCRRLTIMAVRQKSIPEGMVFRLPTEAEWQFACRYYFREFPNGSDDLAQSDRKYWHLQTCGGSMQQVASFTSTNRRVYDMQGNVAEWVLDCWNDRTTWIGSSRDPVVPPKDEANLFVSRGGYWWSDPIDCSEKKRECCSDKGCLGRGFRIVLAFPINN